MKREKILDGIFMQFDSSAKQFSADTKGHFCELSREYKGDHKPQNLKYCFAKIYYNSHIIKFTYTAHGTMGVVNSVLGCSICFDKADVSLEIPLPLLSDYCDADILTPMFVPFITNEVGMIQAFECVGRALKQIFPKIVQISYDPEYKDKTLNAYTDELKNIFEIDYLSNVSNLAFYDFFTLRFTSAAFINLIKGNREKTIIQLKKIKKQIGYEARLLNRLVSEEQCEAVDLSFIKENAEIYNAQGVQKGSLKEFAAIFFSWMIITPATSAVFLGLFYVLTWIEGQNSVYLMGPSYNFPFCIFFGFVTAIAISYFTRLRFYKCFYKKDYEKYCEIDATQNGGGADRFMKGFAAVLFALGIIGTGLTARWNLNFLPDGFIDNSQFFSLKGEYHSYNEIVKVYYKPDRVNDFGDVPNFPSYVLVLKNGEEIDLYEHGEISDYETVLLEHFQNKNVIIER